MDDLEKRVSRANRAAEIISDPLFVEAAQHIEDELWRLFRQALPTDTESLSQIKGMEYMHAKYQAFLKTCIQDGKLARMRIEEAKKPFLKRFLG